MQNKQLSAKNNPEIRLIDTKPTGEKVFSVQWDDEEAYLDIPAMRRVAYLNTAKARTLESKNRALLTEVEEGKIVLHNKLGKEFYDDLKQVRDLIHIGGFGERESKSVNDRIHVLLVGLKSQILQLDFEADKIVQKKLRREIIGEGYTSPMPDEFDLEKQFMVNDDEEEGTEQRKDANKKSA